LSIETTNNFNDNTEQHAVLHETINKIKFLLLVDSKGLLASLSGPQLHLGPGNVVYPSVPTVDGSLCQA